MRGGQQHSDGWYTRGRYVFRCESGMTRDSLERSAAGG